MDVLSADVLQRILEYLPFDEVCGPQALNVGRFAPRRYFGCLFGRRGMKVVSREWRTAAGRALTRGRWRPTRLLEQQGVALVRGLQISTITTVTPESRRGPKPCPAILEDAWAADRGAFMLALITDRAYDHDGSMTTSLGDLVLQFVESDLSDTCRFRRIVSACEYAFGALRSGELLYALLIGWMDKLYQDAWGDWYRPGPAQMFNMLTYRWLGEALENWKDPRLAGKFLVACSRACPDEWDGDDWGHDVVWPPNLLDCGRRMSAEWTDRDQASRFVEFLRSVDAPASDGTDYDAS